MIKWTYSLKNKLVASFALITLCLLVMLSNYLDRNHTNKVKSAIGTLYQDRIMVQDFILDMTSDIYQIKAILNSPNRENSETKNKCDNLLLDIDRLRALYLKTEFTKLETVKFEEFAAVIDTFNPVQATDIQPQLALANKAIELLDELSAIQLNESKNILKKAEELYHNGRILTNFALGIIVIILFVLQALVITSKPAIPKNKQPLNLN